MVDQHWMLNRHGTDCTQSTITNVVCIMDLRMCYVRLGGTHPKKFRNACKLSIIDYD